MRTLRLAMAQINVTVGDLRGNTRKIIDYVERARSLQAGLVVFPELAVVGYPPEDLVFKPQFVRDNLDCVREIAEASEDIAAIVGFIDADDAGLRNAAAVAYGGRLVGVYHKIHLPNYGVFDERRYFEPGTSCQVYVIDGAAVGLTVCEDIWHRPGPAMTQASAGAEVIVNINGSPFHTGKRGEREAALLPQAVDNRVFLAYLNLVGGQDELVFDGASVVLGPSGEVIAEGAQFEEDLVVVDLDLEGAFGPRPGKGRPAPGRDAGECGVVTVSGERAGSPRPPIPDRRVRVPSDIETIYAALVLGTRDYVRKCGFEGVVIALSGGIDSSLTAVIAVDALGPDKVVGVALPSRFSSEGSVLDAGILSENLGIALKLISIEDAFEAYLETLAPHFGGAEWGTAEENLQSRIRGNLVMGLSNKFGWLVLATGNKSEMATGYATMYGDMAGGFAVIKDVPKTMVYELARYRNGAHSGQVIPDSVLTKPPSAELRHDQRDEDSLPPYDVLDPILKAYVEEDRTFQEILDLGFDEAVVRRAIDLVDRSEYKRRQAPPGIKITARNFGRDRRMPIANRYRPF